jgi:hypothetical protein
MNMYLVSSAFTSKPTTLLVCNKGCGFLYGIYGFIQQINTINIDEKLICPIQFPSLLILLDLPNNIF